jgi:hypothetical protein
MKLNKFVAYLCKIGPPGAETVFVTVSSASVTKGMLMPHLMIPSWLDMQALERSEAELFSC